MTGFLERGHPRPLNPLSDSEDSNWDFVYIARATLTVARQRVPWRARTPAVRKTGQPFAYATQEQLLLSQQAPAAMGQTKDAFEGQL